MNREMTKVEPKYGFMRFQVGRAETRLETIPVYVDGKVVAQKSGTVEVPIFRVLGVGPTLAKAERMARH